MNMNPVLAVAVVSVSAIAWVEQHVDNLIHEAPPCWVRSAREMTDQSPSAFAAWCDAKRDGVVTMAEVRAITAAGQRDGIAKSVSSKMTSIQKSKSATPAGEI